MKKKNISRKSSSSKKFTLKWKSKNFGNVYDFVGLFFHGKAQERWLTENNFATKELEAEPGMERF